MVIGGVKKSAERAGETDLFKDVIKPVVGDPVIGF